MIAKLSQCTGARVGKHPTSHSYMRNAHTYTHDALRVASLSLSAVVRDVRYAAHAPKRSADSARGLHFVCSPSGRGRGLTSVERREVNGARSSL